MEVEEITDSFEANSKKDKETDGIFTYTIYNDDFSNKRTENMFMSSISNEIALWRPLEASQLIETNEKGELKGSLKDIAAKLNEEDILF